MEKKLWNEIDLKAVHEMNEILQRQLECQQRIEMIILKIRSKYELTEQDNVKNSGRY